MRLLRLVVGALIVLGAVIAIFPEPAAKRFPHLQVKVLHGEPDFVRLSDLTSRDTSIRNSVRTDPKFELMRSWTPQGIKPLELKMGPIAPVAFAGVTYLGSVRDHEGENALFLECSDGRTRPISTGGVNSSAVDVVFPVGRKFCPKGQIFVRMVAASTSEYLGATEPYELSAISYLKRTYLGYIPYFFMSFGIALATFFMGGVVARASRSGLDPTLAGLIGVGSTSLIIFYLYAWTPLPAPTGLLVVVGLAATAVGTCWRRPALANSVWRAQRGAATAWFLVAFSVFTLLQLGSTGSGAWDPNYRFAPAIWSSDNTLPVFLSEIARIGSFGAEGNLGVWLVTDRPPLMAGAYLMLGDAQGALRHFDDGPYLRPIVLGIGGIVFCALWGGVFYWAARRIGRLTPHLAALGTLIVAATPFALFNTGYTWPKLLAAAFGLAAAAYAFRPRPGRLRAGETAIFGALVAFALLGHAASAFFLAPVSAIYLARRLWRSPKAALLGGAIGLAILGSWSVFKVTTLPSHDPLLKFALVGDFALDRPNVPISQLVEERYDGMTWRTWLATKREMATYLFTPFPAQGPLALARPPATPDRQADTLGRLRNWDFYSLTIGNFAILVLGGMAVFRSIGQRRDLSDQEVFSGRLLVAVLSCYGLFVSATFLPLVIHQFSYDAILACALAGVCAAGGWAKGRSGLAALTFLTVLYTAVVWVAAPLRQLVSVDTIPLAVTLLLAATVAKSALQAVPRSDPAGWKAARNSLLLSVIIGGSLFVAPLLFTYQPASAAGRNSPLKTLAMTPDPARCTGRFDAAVSMGKEGWFVYGWVWDKKAASPAKTVTLVNAANRKIVEATVGLDRPDIPPAFKQVKSSLVGWSGRVPTGLGDLTAIATLADGAPCAVGGNPAMTAPHP